MNAPRHTTSSAIDETLADEVRRLRKENESLRAVFPDVLTALGNGSGCTPTVSIDFIRDIPKEISLVIGQLRAEIARKEAAKA